MPAGVFGHNARDEFRWLPEGQQSLIVNLMKTKSLTTIIRESDAMLKSSQPIEPRAVLHLVHDLAIFLTESVGYDATEEAVDDD